MTRRSRLLWLSLVGVAGFALLFLYLRREVEVVLQHPALPEGTYAVWRANVESRSLPQLAELPPLLSSFVALNREETSVYLAGSRDRDAGMPEGESRSHLAASRLEWEEASAIFVREVSGPLYVEAGRRQAIVFVDAVSDTLASAARSGLSLDAVLSTAATDPGVARYVDQGGLFILEAARMGFVEAGLLIEARRPLLAAVFIDHWARSVQGSLPVNAYLSSQEREWLLRWRVEFQIEGQTTPRIEAALELGSVKGYPSRLNAGVLALADGRFSEAAGHFRAAPEAEAKAYLSITERAGR